MGVAVAVRCGVVLVGVLFVHTEVLVSLIFVPWVRGFGRGLTDGVNRTFCTNGTGTIIFFHTHTTRCNRADRGKGDRPCRFFM